MTEQLLATPELDPKNGFEVIWKSGDETRGKYNLIRIPKATPITINYHKPLSNLEFNISPPNEHNSFWSLKGHIDTDIVDHFGFPVWRQRQGRIAPMVIQDNIDFMSKYGEVTSDLDGEHFLVDLNLEKDRVRNFLYRVWRPAAQTKGFPEDVPNYALDPSNADYRIIPQKILNPNNPTKRVMLTVNRVPLFNQ